jgi:hypothetical protein
MVRHYIWAYTQKTFDYSLRGYSHREHWSCTQWQWTKLVNDQKYHRLLCRQQYSTISLTILSTNWRRLLPSVAIHIYSKEEQLKDFAHFNSQTRLAKKINDSQAKSLRQSLNVVVIKDHKGKTPGSALCGLVYEPECALLVTFHVYNAKKIPVDALGTLRTTGTLSL